MEIPGITPQNYDQAVSVTVSNGSEEMTVSYSPVDHITRQYANSPKAELRTLVHNMYQYQLDACAYAAQTPDLPTATVSEIENDELTFALNFTADTATAAKNCWYGIW